MCSARIASGSEAGLSAQDGMVWHDEQMVTFAGIALRLIEDVLRWLVLLFLRHGLVMYDALYAWCREGRGEAHTWSPRMTA